MEWGREARRRIANIEADVREADSAALQNWAVELDSMRARELLMLDHLSRYIGAPTWITAPVRVDWRTINLLEPSAVSATIASWQRDGFLRERATVALAQLQGPLTTRALALRLLDPVDAVRQRARHILHSRILASNVAEVIDVLAQSPPSRITSDALLWLERELTVEFDPSYVVRRVLASRRTHARRWALTWALQEDLVSEDALVQIALGDRDQWMPPCAARALLEANRDSLAMLSKSTNAAVRSLVVTLASASELELPWLQDLLGDSSVRVRKGVRERYRLAGIDSSLRDRAALAGNGPVAELTVILGEAGRTSSPEMREAVLSSLVSESPRVREAATKALARFQVSESTLPLLLQRLEDRSPRVGRAAANSLAAIRAPYEAADNLWAKGDPHVRRAVWQFWARLGTWPALRGHLLALATNDPLLQGRAQANIAAWCRDVAPRVWGAPEGNLRLDLIALLSQTTLPKDHAQVIKFAGGSALNE